MAKIIVIGGGFAGLSAAAYLSNSGHSVYVYEASPKLGGRAYSFIDSATGDTIDNGQHILMGCYKETLEFLTLIGADKNLIYQNKLSVNFVQREKGITPLSSGILPYPFNLISAIFRYKAISFLDRLKIMKLMLRLTFIDINFLKELSIEEWLTTEGQSEQCKKSFWEIISVGTLNTNTKKASAYIFVQILKEMFFKGNFSSTIIIPKTGLSEMYCNNAQVFIEKNNGKINLSHSINELIVENDIIKKLNINGEIVQNFDFIISAVPSYSFHKILKYKFRHENSEFTYSSILTIHLWLKENKLSELFYGFIDSPLHWVFNHKKHITIVISDADQYNDKNNEEILDIVLPELKTYLNLDSELITSTKIIKEKRATFIPSNILLEKRPQSNTEIRNLFLAGDWINTGLPSTIESAVKSGKKAAEMILKKLP